MYHPKVVERKIETLLRKGKIPAPPSYHTWSECRQMIQLLSSTRQMNHKLEWVKVREFTDEEKAFIRNERLLCKLDFRYFASRYCRIKNEEDREVPFAPWKSQEIFLDIVAENELDQIAILLIVLKARQLGLSRITSLLLLHRLCFSSNLNSILASSQPQKTGLLAEMLEFPLARLPFWLIPSITGGPREGVKAAGMGEFLEFGGTGTSLTLQHGSQFTGIARGTTPTVAHLSELAEFQDASSIVDSALLRAMHDSTRTLLVLEGTAEGQFNWWHDKWLSAKAGWPERSSRLRPVFLPWFVGQLYPKEAWLRARPVPQNYSPEPWVRDHAARAAEYVESSEILKKYLGNGWTMPVEQQWFYQVERGEAMREKRLAKFLQEMPASDDEAFQSTNISVFDTETITHYQDRTKSPLGVYGLDGPIDLLHPRFKPDLLHIDQSKPRLNVNYKWGEHPTQFQLVPLKWSGYPTDSGLDKIYIYEWPEQGEVYGLGFDTGDGIGKDRTTIEVMRKGSPWRHAGQVAEFSTDKLNALDATPFLMALAAMYSVPNLEDGEIRQSRVAIECKGNGDQTQLRMRMHGWTNFHPWQRTDGKVIDKSKFNRIGVYTNSWFRAGMMEYLITMIRDHEIEISSPFFVNEMRTLEGDEVRQSLKACYGGHDDRIMALGFVIISLYQWDKNARVAKPAPKPAAEYQQRRYAQWTPSEQHRISRGES